MILGEKLRTLRHQGGRTLREQSRLIGVSMNSVYRWEHGLSVPRKPLLKVIAGHYNVSLEWLLEDDSAASLVSEIEMNLLGMFRKMSDMSRYKVLGYVERMSLEERRMQELMY
ncbi:MAG: helix-turn-helix domain-containing protein [Oscillospiraceae bacterium]|nr:helix-turn-helix domain-containing protein [Oscillospiraceae bacterium]